MKRIPQVALWLVVRSPEDRMDDTVNSIARQTFENYTLYLTVQAEHEKQWEQACRYAAQDERVQVLCYTEESQTDAKVMLSRHCKEDYLAFLECGDEWQTDKLEKQLEYLYAHPEKAACFTQVAFLSCEKEGQPQGEARPDSLADRTPTQWMQAFLMGHADLWTNSALIRREIYCHPRFCSTSAFALPLRWAWLHICKKNEIGMLPQTMTHLNENHPERQTPCAYPSLAVVLQELQTNLSQAEFAAIFQRQDSSNSTDAVTKEQMVGRFFEENPQSPYAAEWQKNEAQLIDLLRQNQCGADAEDRAPGSLLRKGDVPQQIEVALYFLTDEPAGEHCAKQIVALDGSGSFHTEIRVSGVRTALLRIDAGSLPCRADRIFVRNQEGRALRLEQTDEQRDADGDVTFLSKALHFALVDSEADTEVIHIFGRVAAVLEDAVGAWSESQKQLSGQIEITQEKERRLAETEARLRDCEARLAAQQKHISELEQTQAAIVNSFFWRATWPARAAISWVKKFFSTVPGLRTAYRMAACLKDNGWAVTAEMCKDDLYYHRRFPGKAMPACRFENRAFLRKQASADRRGVKISILVPLYHTPLDYLQEMVDSVRNQTYSDWELCLADAGLDAQSADYLQKVMKKEPRIRLAKLGENLGISGNTNAAMKLATGEYFALLDHDDLLHPAALWYVAGEIANGADFIYTDELTFEGDISNVKHYAFKPDFAPDMLRSCNYICHFSAFSRALTEKAGGGFRSEYDGSQDYDMILRLTEQADQIAHIPHALYYWRASATSVAADISAKQYCIDAAIAALQAHLERLHQKGRVCLIPGTPGFYKIEYELTAQPLVSILIPSCDHVEDLDQCVSSICKKTSYSNYEILIIENNSQEQETFAYYKKLSTRANIRVVYYPEGESFNYSRLNNFGAKYAKGEVLLLLNNDMKIISEHWLEEMLMYAQQPQIGAVGAMLYYPDDTVQHAGVGIGIGGIAGHLHKMFPRTGDGYMGRMHYAQNVGAVTGACCMLRREVYDRVHGLNPDYAVAFNDIDLCMRIRREGYRIVFTPHAKLYHYESKSRGEETTPEKQARFLSEIRLFERDWQHELDAKDPFYNINLSLHSEQFELAVRPLQEN